MPMDVLSSKSTLKIPIIMMIIVTIMMMAISHYMGEVRAKHKLASANVKIPNGPSPAEIILDKRRTDVKIY